MTGPRPQDDVDIFAHHVRTGHSVQADWFEEKCDVCEWRRPAVHRGPQDEEAAEVCHYPTTHTPGCGCGALRRDEVYPVPVKPSPGPDDPAWDRLNTPGPQRPGEF